MIRKAKENDLDVIMNIWLNTNISSHYFIDKQYWINHFDLVKQSISVADVYVFEEENIIKGFIGLIDNNIEGIFVKEEYQSQSIGRQLLAKVKEEYSQLTLNVYCENKKAVQFYKKNFFKVIKKQKDKSIEHKEYTMKWQK